MIRIFTNFLILACLSTFIGCSTIKGVGQDLSSIGRGISGTADNVKDSIKNRHNK